MRRIAQRHFSAGDCGIACAAMISRKPYDVAHAAALKLGLRGDDGTYYTYHQDLERLLHRLKVKRVIRRRFTSWRRIDVPAIVKTNTRQSGRFWHWVVVFESRNGERIILDPKPGKRANIVSLRGYRGAGQYLHVA